MWLCDYTLDADYSKFDLKPRLAPETPDFGEAASRDFHQGLQDMRVDPRGLWSALQRIPDHVPFINDINGTYGDSLTLRSAPEPDVGVTGRRDSVSGYIVWVSGGEDVEPVPLTDDRIEPGETNDPLTDEDVVEIKINIANPTAQENLLIEKYKEAILRADKAIQSLADNSRIRLTNGA